MNAAKKVRNLILQDSESDRSKLFVRLLIALVEETDFNLHDFYQLNHDDFELAMSLLKDWRLERYYASKTKLWGLVLNIVEEGKTAPSDNQA